MEIVSKPIDVIAVFNGQALPRPYKFKCCERGCRNPEVKVDRIVCTEKQHIAGQNSYIYECISVVGGIETRYQLKYVIAETKWLLYKI